MSKHRLSPAPLPPSKRLHTDVHHAPPPARLTFDSALYDELILYIFSHLSWADLCATQHTSRNWARLAADNELWRALYLQVYGRPRLRGLRGFITRMDGREVKPLPGRAKVDDDHRDWKWMFRISSNWKTGRCAREDLGAAYELAEGSPNILVQLAGSLSIAAPTEGSLCPFLYLHEPSGSHHLACKSTRGDGLKYSITAIAVDQSQPVSGHIRLATFLDTGEFTIFDVPYSNVAHSKAKMTYVPRLRTNRNSPIIQAVYHHPLLLTLSDSFSLSIYDLSSDGVVHKQTLSTFTSFPPSSLVLSTPSPYAYKLILTYAIPVYPAHWSVGATELMISGPSLLPPASSSTSILDSVMRPQKHPPMSVISTRSARTLDTPQGWIDEKKLRIMREQWSRKVLRVADTQTDGKWVVLAPGDSQLEETPFKSASSSSTFTSAPSLHSPIHMQLYRLSLPSASTPPKLTFVRNLTGQTGPISATSLADGRCVSMGVNGSIWVWDLEGGTGAEVSPPRFAPLFSGEVLSTDFERRTVVFDERRIITTEAGRVVVRRFDI